MSRLIDADELLEHVYRDRLDSRELIANMVENAPTVNQWIPCSEELPKQQKKVLIQDGNDITIGYLNGENRWRDLTNLDDYLKAVIAWMPLPSPFTEETK